MALPTWLDLKYLLKVQTDREDGGPSDSPSGSGNGNGLLARVMERAQARVESYIERPIVAERITMRDQAISNRAFEAIHRLIVPQGPISRLLQDAPEIKDKDGVVVDPATYYVDYDNALIVGLEGVTFEAGPYDITATVGLSARPDYARIEPDLAQCILDVAVDLYSWRAPAVTHRSAGGGVSEGRDPKTGIPLRVCAALDKYRRIGWA